MNISYLLSILDLYLLKENNRVLVIQVDNQTNQVKVNFSYSTDSINKTFVKIDKDIFFTNLSQILKKIQANLENPLEKFEKVSNHNVYSLNFNNQRKLTFLDFTLDEFNFIRSKFTNLTGEFEFNLIQEQLERTTYDKQLSQTKSPKLAFSMGFTSYLTLFISSVFFLDIFMIALLIFKIS